MTEKLWATALLTFGGSAMILARRWNNEDSEAGIGIASVVCLILLIMW